MKNRGLPSLLVLLLLLAGCSTRTMEYPNDDYGPARPVDVSHVPDAVPRDEPYSKYGNPSSYTVRGRTYHVLDTGEGYREKGLASWYGLKFHGRRTSSGEAYDMYAMTAAHKTLPLPTWVRVTNLDNGSSVVVKVNDRGPFHSGRIIDLSYAAASRLGVLGKGTAPVEVVALQVEKPATVAAKAADARQFPLWVQAGAFASEANARLLLHRLEGLSGLQGRIRPLEQLSGRIYRVWLGPVSSEWQLQQLTKKLPEWGIESYRVVQ
ncbi:septal ring lytic transglycosylase RlpA family protein [Thiolapillus sp.]|nr:septal ring lytic transglycosylase RlpA family protein [Thiolapillus sp.]